MAITLKSKMAALPKARQEKIKKRASELIKEEATLSELRKAFELTQVELADRLNINQEAVSRLEKRSDLLISTLQSYVKAMGGELTITAAFPDHPAIKISGFSGLNAR
jgi:transcriptional regulator with XRE-family HTH domain